MADRWWTEEPVRRRYFEVVLETGRNVVVFRDEASGKWFRQRSGACTLRPSHLRATSYRARISPMSRGIGRAVRRRRGREIADVVLPSRPGVFRLRKRTGRALRLANVCDDARR